jgi:endo-1,4-beta-xylanase
VNHRRLRRAIVAITCIFCLPTMSKASVSSVTMFSPANNRNVSFYVYLPPNYATATSTRYPTVYSLHGIGGTPQARSSLAGPVLDSLIASGDVPPMIWVFPDGQTDSFYGDAFDGHKRVYTNIVGEVLPYVDANYRTIADRDHRATDGFSMGGFGASMLAGKRPDLFSAVVESGGALSKWADLVAFNNAVAVDMYNSVEANFTPFSLWDRTDANANTIRTTVNYKMIVGDADPQEGSNERFRDHLISLNIDPHYQVLPGVMHVQGQYLSEGSNIRFLGQHFASIPEPAFISIASSGFALLALARRRGQSRVTILLCPNSPISSFATSAARSD